MAVLYHFGKKKPTDNYTNKPPPPLPAIWGVSNGVGDNWRRGYLFIFG